MHTKSFNLIVKKIIWQYDEMKSSNVITIMCNNKAAVDIATRPPLVTLIVMSCVGSPGGSVINVVLVWF